MSQNENRNEKKTTVIIAILVLITVAALCVTMWALFFREPSVVLTPDYAPQETEKNQTPIEGDNGNKMDVDEGSGAVSLTYSDKVTIDLSDEKVTLDFGNPGKSTQNMVIQVVIREQILVQSGTLTPGNKVTTLDLLDGTSKNLSLGGYEGKFVILYYNSETGEKAVVNTEIPISITVQE